jgi:hypothetical protein
MIADLWRRRRRRAALKKEKPSVWYLDPLTQPHGFLLQPEPVGMDTGLFPQRLERQALMARALVNSCFLVLETSENNLSLDNLTKV